MNSWEWSGAKWWKFDFHAHTPASKDYGNHSRSDSPSTKEWLLDYMAAGIDCVAITDHNSGAWINDLKAALDELERERPEGYRPIHLFPGVEISVSGGIHLLAIFGQEKTQSDIDTLLGAVGYQGQKGSSDSVTTKSFPEVVSAIVAAGGIPIPAHADRSKGIFSRNGQDLLQILNCRELIAMEIVDPQWTPPSAYSEMKLEWPRVLGSDSHHTLGAGDRRAPGSGFTWIKMGLPGIEGLRLALMDGALSVRRPDEFSGDPNEHTGLAIESIEISDARYLGLHPPFSLPLNPWLNAIIGGRGTGKSTIVEFIRLAMRRDGEIPANLSGEFKKYFQAYTVRGDGGLLRNETVIRVIYRKDGGKFRIQWKAGGALEPIEEECDGIWIPASGDIRSRFPIRIFSQKQIYHLATQPRALRLVIDESPEVGLQTLLELRKEEEARYLSFRSKAREIEAGLSEEPRLRGELDDLKRKLALFEEKGQADILKEFQKRRKQRQALESWEQEWSQAGNRLRRLAEEILPSSLETSFFDHRDSIDGQVMRLGKEITDRFESLRRSLENLAEQADQIHAQWKADLAKSSWSAETEKTLQAYHSLQKSLTEEGASEPISYGTLIQQRQIIEQRLNELAKRKKEVELLDAQSGQSLGRLVDLRRRITQARRDFLDRTLRNNQFVKIGIVAYGSHEEAESEFRELIQREDGGFEKDIGKDIGERNGEGLLGELYQAIDDQAAFEEKLRDLKNRVRAIANNATSEFNLADKRFSAHLGKLAPEVFDRIDLWFPEDSVNVQYSATGKPGNFRSIEEGSPGQKTAALLAFLLSYGKEPLILDQPEDDLDNHLIYDLIVTQLRQVKLNRQMIVVTHNANIVVNGDAELVIALDARNGQTQIETSGSLQGKRVRDVICAVMEGGRKAFDQRYRRIALEENHVR